MAIAIFMLLLTIFPYALFAQCNPNCCPAPLTFGIYPPPPSKQTLITTKTLLLHDEPCDTGLKTDLLSGTYSLTGFVTEGQCLSTSTGYTSIWLLINQKYVLDELNHLTSPKCYCGHVR